MLGGSNPIPSMYGLIIHVGIYNSHTDPTGIMTKYPPGERTKHIWPGKTSSQGIPRDHMTSTPNFHALLKTGKTTPKFKKDLLRIKFDPPTKKNWGRHLMIPSNLIPIATATKWIGYVSCWNMYVMPFLHQLPCHKETHAVAPLKDAETILGQCHHEAFPYHPCDIYTHLVQKINQM